MQPILHFIYCLKKKTHRIVLCCFTDGKNGFWEKFHSLSFMFYKRTKYMIPWICTQNVNCKNKLLKMITKLIPVERVIFLCFSNLVATGSSTYKTLQKFVCCSYVLHYPQRRFCQIDFLLLLHALGDFTFIIYLLIYYFVLIPSFLLEIIICEIFNVAVILKYIFLAHKKSFLEKFEKNLCLSSPKSKQAASKESSKFTNGKI